MSAAAGTAGLTELPSMPSLAGLYATTARKAAAAATVGRVLGDARNRDLPGHGLIVRGVTTDAEALGSYQHLFGDTVTELLPPGFVHVQAFPLHVALMNVHGFPFPPAGLVHVVNRVEQVAPLTIGRPLDIRATATNLRAHPKGTAFDVVTAVALSEAAAGDAPAWRSTSTYLARGAAAAEPAAAPSSEGDPPHQSDSTHRSGPAPEPEFATPVDADEPLPDYPTGVWKLAGDTGRRYAAVSGDINPIHLNRVSARVFGFHHPIAHGMYTAVRALASLPHRRAIPLHWDVTFGSPVYLPSTVAVATAPASDGASGAEYVARTGRAADASGRSTVNPVRGVVWSPRSGRVHLRFTVRSG